MSPDSFNQKRLSCPADATDKHVQRTAILTFACTCLVLVLVIEMVGDLTKDTRLVGIQRSDSIAETDLGFEFLLYTGALSPGSRPFAGCQ